MNAPDDLTTNPFLVLGLSPDASDADLERQGQKLAGLLRMGSSAATTYETPWGPRSRDAEAVRRALTDLRRPERRLLYELLYEGVRAKQRGTTA